MSHPSRSDARRRLVIDSLGVGVATGVYGLSFGAIGATSGLTVLETCVLSLVVFTGASQFAMVGVVASGGAPMAGAATALMLGTRNTLYGLRLASLLKVKGARRFAAAQIVTDETTAMALKPDDPADAPLGFFTTGVSIYILWNLTTLIGAVAGNSIGEPASYGLDAAVPAAFLALVWPRLDTTFKRLASLTAAALALTLVPVTTPGVPVIAAAGIAILAALRPDATPRHSGAQADDAPTDDRGISSRTGDP